ncbi:universal stress protein [Phytomonospora sp. NPDC050363]|uniref:universal stress protein n=1 Tax=Phytomonospora sp. NPDC050363 TaxID=3155642 RepID=UPI0034013E0B
MTESPPITVGVDGSSSSPATTAHAAAIATRRGAPLRIVHAYLNPLYSYPMLAYAGDPSDVEMREHAERILRELVESVRADNPGLDVEGEFVDGTAAAALVERSAGSAVTVIGSRGHGGFAGLLLGSVSTQVAGHGSGPVVVVHDRDGERAEDAPVAVGYDASEGSESALLFAADEALSRGTVLEVLCFHTPGDDEERPKAEEIVADAVRRLTASHPDLKVDGQAVEGMDPAFRLITRSRSAALTVVGSRGMGGFTGMLLGSVGRTLLHHAYGPIAVVHPREVRDQNDG